MTRLEILSQKNYNTLKEWYSSIEGIEADWPFSTCRRLKNDKVACLRKKSYENKSGT